MPAINLNYKIKKSQMHLHHNYAVPVILITLQLNLMPNFPLTFVTFLHVLEYDGVQ